MGEKDMVTRGELISHIRVLEQYSLDTSEAGYVGMVEQLQIVNLAIQLFTEGINLFIKWLMVR